MEVILALETSTEVCSVALTRGDAVHHRHRVEPRAHNRILLPMIDALLEEAGCTPADLGAIAFGCGPGSFTGLRIAAAVTQGIAWARDIPVLGVSTLEIVAATAASRSRKPIAGIVTLLDARMGELYWNAFLARPNGLAAIGPDALAVPQAIAGRLPGLCGAHPGRWWIAGAELLGSDDLPRIPGVDMDAVDDVLPDARALLELARPRLLAGEGLPARDAIPHYLRDEKRWRRIGDPVPA